MIRILSASIALLTCCLAPAQDKVTSQPTLRKLGRTVCFARPLLLPPSPIRVEDQMDMDRTIGAILASRAQSYVFPLEKDRNRLPELNKFLPKAKAKGIAVWVRILPPTLGANMKPHLGDYKAWAEEIAKIGKEHTNLVALYIPDLDYGRNRRVLSSSTLAGMRKTLHVAGVRLVAGLFDPTPRVWGHLKNELDGAVCTWVQAKELRNLGTFLAGARALTPKHIPVLAGYPCKGLAPGKHVMTPEVLGFAIRHALRVTDGVFLRDFVLRDKNTNPIDRKRFEIAAKQFVDVKRD
jgi:hypothetical protein